MWVLLEFSRPHAYAGGEHVAESPETKQCTAFCLRAMCLLRIILQLINGNFFDYLTYGPPYPSFPKSPPSNPHLPHLPPCNQG